jgi:alkylation response protein AidB-like acyl-CoA dehydrogenase
MNLYLDESQRILVDSFADFFAKECPSSLVREAESLGFSVDLWRLFSEMGAPCMGLSESNGGLGLGLLELCLVSCAAGKVLAPLPFAEVASSSRLISNYLNDTEFLEKIANGSELISIVDIGSSGPGVVENGARQWVPFGAVVQHVVTLEGTALVLYSAIESHSTVMVNNLGSGAHDFWLLTESNDTRRTVLAQGMEVVQAFEKAIAEWKLITAAALCGLSQQALFIGVDYAKNREQFGTIIGAFQAVSHPLADCAMRVDGAELLVWEAAWAGHAQPQRFQELCSMALIFSSQTAQETTSVSLHTHGGYGFTEEYDIQMYYRRACAWSMMAGGVSNELLRLASLRSKTISNNVSIDVEVY